MESIKNLDGEVWKPVVGFDGLYEVSNMGRIKSLARKSKPFNYDRILKLQHSKDGYQIVQLMKGSEYRKTFRVHQLVMMSFTDYEPRGNDPNYQIDHVNGNKNDNRLENLEIVTHKENMRRAKENNLIGHYTRKVICLDDGVIYNSMKEAARSVGLGRSSSIKRVCSGRASHAGGKHFSFLEDYENGTIPEFTTIRGINRRMGAINSKAKGSRGEREVAKILKEHGYADARRTVQYCGSSGEAADVIGLPGFHLEIKRVERMELYKWYDQAVRDSSGSEDIPIVVHRKNNADWLVSMSFEDFLKIIQ